MWPGHNLGGARTYLGEVGELGRVCSCVHLVGRPVGAGALLRRGLECLNLGLQISEREKVGRREYVAEKFMFLLGERARMVVEMKAQKTK